MINMINNEFKHPIILDSKVFEKTKFYYTREDFLKKHNPIKSYLEIGVLAGDYSDLVIKYLNPKIIDLVDTYDSKDYNQINNKRFEKETHFEYIKNKYKNNNNINIIKENFNIKTTKLSNKYDYIYIDAHHTIGQVSEQLNWSANHINDDGIIGIDDYIILDHFSYEYYGVVQAVHYFLNQNNNWYVYAFSLGDGFHHSIYLKKMI